MNGKIIGFLADNEKAVVYDRPSAKLGLLDLSNGATVWSRPLRGGSLVFHNGSVVLVHQPQEGRLKLIAAATGELRELPVDPGEAHYDFRSWDDTPLGGRHFTPDGRYFWLRVFVRDVAPAPTGWFARWWPWRRRGGPFEVITVIDCEHGEIVGRIEEEIRLFGGVSARLSADGKTLVTYGLEDQGIVLKAWDLPFRKAHPWLAWLPLGLGAAVVAWRLRRVRHETTVTPKDSATREPS